MAVFCEYEVLREGRRIGSVVTERNERTGRIVSRSQYLPGPLLQAVHLKDMTCPEMEIEIRLSFWEKGLVVRRSRVWFESRARGRYGETQFVYQ